MSPVNRLLVALLVSTTMLLSSTAIAFPVERDVDAGRSVSSTIELEFPVYPAADEAAEGPSEPGLEDAPLELAVQKLDPEIQDLVLAGAKETVEVLVFSMDVPALARVMQKYPYEGLLGLDAVKSEIPIAVYLKLPAYALQEISQMESTLFVGKERRVAPGMVDASPPLIGP